MKHNTPYRYCHQIAHILEGGLFRRIQGEIIVLLTAGVFHHCAIAASSAVASGPYS